MTLSANSSTDQVVAWMLGARHLSCVDEDERPLGEQACPSYRGGGEEVRRFGDSRDDSGLPCNVAALAQLQQTWPTLLRALSSFEAEQPNTTQRMLRRADAGNGLALVLALRGPPVKRHVAALFKVTLGFSELLATMLIEQRVDADAPPPTVRVLFEWLDERPWLIGETQVCAGTRAQIARVWTALQGNESDDDNLWAEVSPTLSPLRDLAVLAAIAAGAARVAAKSGRVADGACRALYTAPQVPRLAEALRQVPGAGPLHHPPLPRARRATEGAGIR